MTKDFLNKIDTLIQSKHLLNNPFYLAWSRGELSKECLKEYAMEYYHHVKAFPRYICAILSHAENTEVRKHLLTNLIEEEAGSPNHPDMWRSFALSLGATDAEIDAYRPSSAITNMIDTFMDISFKQNAIEGVAALYAYESQIPPVCVSKIKGLKKFYGMKNPQDWKYFSVHIEADKEHAAIERELLEKHIQKDMEEPILKAVDRVLDALNGFLDSLCVRYNLCAVKM